MMGAAPAPPSASDQPARTADSLESEEQFRQLISNMTDFAVYTTDCDGCVTSWNAGAARLNGYAAEEALGRPCSIFDLPEDAAAGRLRHALQIAARDRRHEEESWRVRKDGSRFFAHVVTSPLHNASGRLRGFVRVIRDITERNEADTGIAHLAAIVESSQDAIIGTDLDSVILTWNQGAERLYGYTRAETVGRSITILVPPEGLAEHRNIMSQIRRGEPVRTLETAQLRNDGSRVDVSVSTSLVKDPGGAIIGASVVVRDVTERKRNEASLRHSEARLRAVLETAIDSIITIDERGRIQSVNPATVRMFGHTAAEMIGRNVSMLMPSPYRDEHDGYLARYRQTGERRIIGIGREVQAQRKDGTVFPVDLAVSEVEAGTLFTGVIRDITDRKLGETRLREADRMASIGALAAGLGHDMNNVLLPVRAHLNALRAKARGRRGDHSHLRKIQQGVSYLQQLADGLHFLAMDPDRIDDAAGSTDLRGWWAQTGALLSKAVPKHVKVTSSLPTR
jgi:PAS domain S-box-containing protein